jgi:hypothetical protein
LKSDSNNFPWCARRYFLNRGAVTYSANITRFNLQIRISLNTKPRLAWNAYGSSFCFGAKRQLYPIKCSIRHDRKRGILLTISWRCGYRFAVSLVGMLRTIVWNKSQCVRTVYGHYSVDVIYGPLVPLSSYFQWTFAVKSLLINLA